MLINFVLLVIFLGITISTHAKSKERKRLSKQIIIESDKLIYHLNNGGVSKIQGVLKLGKVTIPKGGV